MKAIELAAQAISPPKPPELPVTHVALLVDNSGSMASVMGQAREMALSQYNTIVTSFAGQKVAFDLWTIDSNPHHLMHVDPGGVHGVKEAIFRMRAGGGTPLYRTIGDAADLISSRFSVSRGDAAVVIVVTDGQDTEYSDYQMDRARAHMRRTDGWSFAVVGPAGVLRAVSEVVPPGNVLEWDGSAEQLTRVSGTMGMSLNSYSQARSKGIRSVTNYFTANLPSEAVVKSALSNSWTVPVRTVKVDAEEPIEDKVVRWTRKPYAMGQAFYQLTKTEKIQPQKEILIREKGKDVYYGGPNVRGLLGLPKDKDAKVTPGNFGNYDIFVQSTSVNRKLVRGTDLVLKVNP